MHLKKDREGMVIILTVNRPYTNYMWAALYIGLEGGVDCDVQLVKGTWNSRRTVSYKSPEDVLPSSI